MCTTAAKTGARQGNNELLQIMTLIDEWRLTMKRHYQRFSMPEYAFQFISNQSTKLCRCSGPMVNRNYSVCMRSWKWGWGSGGERWKNEWSSFYSTIIIHPAHSKRTFSLQQQKCMLLLLLEKGFSVAMNKLFDSVMKYKHVFPLKTVVIFSFFLLVLWIRHLAPVAHIM